MASPNVPLRGFFRPQALPPGIHDEKPPEAYSEQLDKHRDTLAEQAPPIASKYCILAIETSCDDACAAVISSDGAILAEERASNPESLVKFGGIKPDESYRFHLANLDSIIQRVLTKSGVKMDDVKRIAVTRGPGMRICLKAGYASALMLAQKYAIPLIGENHLAGHCLSPFIQGHQLKVTHEIGAERSTELRYPFLSLLLSGGHSQIYVVEDPAKFHMIVDTMDHYAGNVLYKCAKELDLPIDNGGGPSVEKAARKMEGDCIFNISEPCKDMSFTSFCFSGIQTQLRELLIRLRREYGANVTSERPGVVHHLAYACQEAVFQQILRQLNKALDISETLFGIDQLVVVGGVSCNKRLREVIAQLLHEREESATKRKRNFISRIYGQVNKAGSLRRFDRKDADDNILIQNLMERMSGVKDISGLLKLLWTQDLYPDLLQRRDGVHISVQQKNAFYSAVIQAYVSLLSDKDAYNMHRNLQHRVQSNITTLKPSAWVLAQLAELERQDNSSLIYRHMKSDRPDKYRWQLFTTSSKYCTDNAVMIGYSLLEKHRAGLDGLHEDVFDEDVTDRWNLSSRRHWELLTDIAHLHALTED
ncbi:tRNA N6-adenosine threonylcarbamoyltransferase [Babesia sp. Xinjiang]|uniref:tRNA N6-adenosine threonylcarbamoyltransferase n=1 Tax=Babesia sp. Xinjiang TaxID=462227 RepID=UPI000A22557C|nr:tRNA N6-adenosine threonylcarbamoyltransferase [Babesia sp. Xinjiang]ORM39938.1 tRNA N6-adenosine threonylcarbamoyltransferase [Babesia sp. Xinjiang]